MAKTKREIILDNLSQIEAWSAEGKTVRWMAQELGVSKSLLYQMMKEDREADESGVGQSTGLMDCVKNGRDQAIEKIECTMFNSAIGFTRKEKKCAKLKRILYDNGKKTEEYEEMVEYEEERYYPPDATSGIFLLKNWARYANEPVTNDLRRREIELKEKQAEANSW